MAKRQQTQVRALFETEAELLDAARLLRERNCRHCECYAPKPIEAFDAIWKRPRSRLPQVAFVGGLLGAIGGYGMQHYTMAISYPHNVGGRPLVSWPIFLPVTFELMVLAAALTGMAALLIRLGLPKLYQPILDSPLAARVNVDAFLLEALPASDSVTRLGAEKAAAELETLLENAGAVATETVVGEGGSDA